MGWLSNAWESVTDTVSSAAEYVASGEIVSDIAYVATEAYETGAYIIDNPLHSLHVAGEGIQQGISSATGTIVGGVSGLATNGYQAIYNSAAMGVENILDVELDLYEGTFGEVMGNNIGAVTGAVQGAQDFIQRDVFRIEDPVMRNEYDRYIMGATQGLTEVAVGVVVVATTAGAGSALYTGSLTAGAATTGAWTMGAVNTTLGASLTTVGTAMAVSGNIDEQLTIVETNTALVQASVQAELERLRSEQGMAAPALAVGQ